MKALQLTRTLYLGLIGGLVLFTGCEGDGILPCENGDGTRVSEPRSESGFDQVRLDLPGDVYITKGEDFNIEITAQGNIIDQIETEVQGNVLQIKNKRCIRSYKTIRVDIIMPDISGLEVDGSGDIYVLDRFSGNDLDLLVKGSGSIDMIGDAQSTKIEVNGSGDVSLQTQSQAIETLIKGAGDVLLIGSADKHFIEMEGAGNLKAFELSSELCDVRITGSGDADIHVTEELKVVIRGSGDVRYKGTPAVDASITGSGQLESVN